ncbi:MAG: PIN domain-containing protein [Actinomycetota bacterium]
MNADALEFVDTNILVYAHSASAGAKRKGAIALIERLWRDERAAISLQVLHELNVVLTQRVRPPIPAGEVVKLVSDLAEWKVHEPRVEDTIPTLAIHRRHRVSLWDALILRSASVLGCAVLWSEDLQDGRTYDGVTVRNPFRTS